MRKSIAILAFTAILLGGGQRLHAVLIAVNISAKVTFVQNQPVLGITTSVGAPVTAQFIYDTNATDTNPSAAQGVYSGGSGFVSLAGTTLTTSGPSLQVVFDQLPPSNDLFSFTHGTPQGTGPVLVNGVANANARFSFGFTQPAGLLVGDDLPNVAEYALLQVSQFNIVQQGTNGVIIFDNIVSITASVIPEASPVAFGGVALAVFAACGVFCRKRSAK